MTKVHSHDGFSHSGSSLLPANSLHVHALSTYKVLKCERSHLAVTDRVHRKSKLTC